MKGSCYFHENEVILDYSAEFIETSTQLVNSDFFNTFLDQYLNHLETSRRDLHDFLYAGGRTRFQVREDLKKSIKLLMFMNMDRGNMRYIQFPDQFLEVVSDIYRWWRSLQRYSIFYSQNSDSYQTNAFMNVDTQINAIARELYRTLERNITGVADNMYRQLQAGTNASLLLKHYDWDCPAAYAKLRDVAFVHTIMVRTPLIIETKSNKRTNVFKDHTHHPMEDFAGDPKDWVCYPAWVGESLIYTYFYQDYMSSCVASSGLFQLAREEDCHRKPDAILLFGNPDGTKDTVFWKDKETGIWIGKTSASEEIDYFGYAKKSILTLNNLVMMERGWLPIHGSMVNLYLKDGRKKTLMFMGDSGAGKSETLEALSSLASDLIDHQETVFDDMGSIHINAEGKLVAEGTEIGAFVRLDDLDQATAYKELDRSIFFNPDKKNARVVMPAAPYKTVVREHPIDCLFYANNYDDRRGIHLFENAAEAKTTFIEGKRNALGTTQEKGLSSTFFANPFGPMQRQQECSALIDRMFEKMLEDHISLGEVYTCLGLRDKGDHGIQKAAEELLEFVQKDAV